MQEAAQAGLGAINVLVTTTVEQEAEVELRVNVGPGESLEMGNRKLS